MQQERDEIAQKIVDRRVARYCRRVAYRIRRVEANDSSIDAIEVALEDVVPSLMKAMSKNSYVLKVEISCTGLSIGGVVGRMLQSNTTLRTLKIRACHIPPFSAAAIFRSLKHNSTLQDIDLSLSWGLFEGPPGDPFSKMNATAALADAITSSTSLKSLNLRKTSLGGEQIQSLFWALSRNKTLENLDLSENDGIGLALVESLIQHLPELRLQIVNAELTGVSECLDQQPKLMGDLAAALEANSSLWKLTGIVLHKVEHYAKDKEKSTQLRCVQLSEQMDLFKTRNGIVGAKWLCMENRALWALLLGNLLQGKNERFRLDLVFFLLREKCDWLTAGSSDRTTPGDTTGSLLGESKSRNLAGTCSTAILPKKRVRLEYSRVQLGISKKTKQRDSNIQNHCTTEVSGYYCFVHAACGSLPRGCCSFERKLP